MNKTKKFYVASDTMSNDIRGWRKETLEAAVEHAQSILERNPIQEECLIVRVVAVVKRRKLPVLVEKIK